MSELTWSRAAARVAGAVGLAARPETQEAAKDAIEETLEDWDTRRDWRFSQVVAPDITLSAGASTFDLPTVFKKPYVAYMTGTQTPLFYVERANWHRVMPGYTGSSVSRWYTMYNEASTGKGDLFPTSAGAETLILLYYRGLTYRDSGDAFLDIPRRWQGYILNGAKARLTLGKESRKAEAYFALYEAGIKQAKEDDQRIPDQFVSFQPPSEMQRPYWLNPNSTWASVVGDY